MKKIMIIVCFLVFGLVACSEKNFFEKMCDKPKNVVASTAKRIMNTATYEDGSLQQKMDFAVLATLPPFISQAVLQKQRSNMSKSLIKNEEQTLEGARQYWDVEKPSWEEILEQNKKEHQCNLDQLRSEKNINAFHDPSLPPQWLTSAQEECKRYGFNINNIRLGVTDKPTGVASTVELADFAKKTLNSDSITPIIVNFNLQCTHFPQSSISHTATHEFTHVGRGDSLLQQNILHYGPMKPIEEKLNQIKKKIDDIESVSFWQILNPFYPSGKKLEDNEKK